MNRSLVGLLILILLAAILGRTFDQTRGSFAIVRNPLQDLLPELGNSP